MMMVLNTALVAVLVAFAFCCRCRALAVSPSDDGARARRCIYRAARNSRRHGGGRGDARSRVGTKHHLEQTEVA